MNMPGYHADASLGRRAGRFRRMRAGESAVQSVVPAIPACRNCDAIIDRCLENGMRPRAVCNACLSGNCYSGTEFPPDPPAGAPWQWWDTVRGAGRW